MPFSSGSRLGPYEVAAPLGAGGMGEVYRARDTRLGRDVAVKVLPEDIARDAARRQRFEHEARTAGSLSHPNLLTVFDVGAENGAYYLVTELVEGESLRAVIQNGPLGARRIADIGSQTAEGLAAAHAAGVVHRDLKPENIMLGRDGRIRILDFGLAKTRARAAALETATSPMTDPGTVVGTTSYMSPEQIRGEEVDGRSDLFSLGIVLYELAAGARPFQKPTSVETMTAILREDVEEVPASLGPHLQSVVRRCLEKDPARRFQSAADLAFSLRTQSSGAASTTATAIQPASPAAPRFAWRYAAAGVLAVILAAAAFFAGRRTAPEKLPDWTVRPLTAYPGREAAPALSPDGSQFAFEWAEGSGKTPGVFVRLVDSEPPLRVSSGPGAWPCWSPDGKRIAFRRHSQILVVPALGGAERKIAEFPPEIAAESKMAWSPDGNWIVTNTKSGLMAVRVETGEMRNWLPSSGDTPWMAFSPDGRRLAYTKGSTFSQYVYVLDISPDGDPSGAPRRISDREFNPDGLVWRADAQSLIVSATLGSRYVLWNVDTRDGSAHLLPIENTSAESPTISYAGGRLAYERLETDSNIWHMEKAGAGFTNPEPLIHSTSVESDIQFCAGGKWIVFRTERTGETAIWRSDRDGSNQIPLARLDATRVGSPRCSPDGSRVVFDGYHEGNTDLYLVSAEGGEPKRLTKTPWNEIRPAFTMDGKSIVFGSRRSGEAGIWKVPVEGGDEVQLTGDGGEEPFPSADGRFIFYAKVSSQRGIWRIPVEGGTPVPVAEFGRVGNIAIAGGNLYWGDSPNGKDPGHISVFNPATGQTSRLLSIPPEIRAFGYATSLAVSPDEKTILFVRIDRYDSDLMLVENFR